MGRWVCRVICIGFVGAGGECSLCDATVSIVGEICGVAICVGDAEQIILGVVGVAGAVARRVGDGG